MKKIPRLATELLLEEYAKGWGDIPKYFSNRRAFLLFHAARWAVEEIRLLRAEVKKLKRTK